MSDTRALSLVAVMAAVTIFIRFLPFQIFRSGQQTPPVIGKLGALLPCAVMGMLVVYCLRNVDFTAPPHALPEVIAVGLTALLHLWRRNTLLSIIAGTICYMVLVQAVFV